MPSYRHELFLFLFANHSGVAADLLRNLDVQLPEYDEIRDGSSDLNDLRPAEYRADLVLLLSVGHRRCLGSSWRCSWDATKASPTPGLPM